MSTLLSFRFIVTVLVTTLILYGCERNADVITNIGGGTNTTTTNMTLTGIVIDKSSSSVIDSASVFILYGLGSETVKAGTDGVFSFKAKLDTNRIITLIVSKVGYKTDTLSVFVTLNTTNNLAPIKLTKLTTTGTTVSGPASSVFLATQSATFIGVRESGSQETAKLTFIVVDSAGRTLSASQSALVKFKFGSKPDGGEFINPEFVYTDTSGQASVFLTSGTKAGAVQIIAEITLPGKTITSLPIGIAIHGGAPDAGHFGIAAQKINFPGYNIFGLENTISAYLGDKYGNPVRPKTTVYFTTTGGIVQGSAQTNDDGIATVKLISAEPRPEHPILGRGFGTVTAFTADGAAQTISNSMPVLFSGVSLITCTPSSFSIPNGGSQQFIYEIKDQNGNPLSGGTTVTVSVTGTDLESTGDLSVNIPDTQSKSWTRFGFLLYDSRDTVDVSKPASIKISTSGPNGGNTLIINGSSR